ncbi:MAG: hypothetical protein ACRC6L_14580 [Steroidobacteraceae bacterium]
MCAVVASNGVAGHALIGGRNALVDESRFNRSGRRLIVAPQNPM